ncbi:oligosaccharide repeat unit polymerase [uncultured Capnocytophaga sp.]|uniref:oligosaccharide repeat unit polymerase n=1 Tax=uncultured Capnocytophaga sp. TaxID=159273 RepID=UPI0026283D44|nr:oligosaccharide repeat unit polymerase [uncultured Capnocytophaga sp.]
MISIEKNINAYKAIRFIFFINIFYVTVSYIYALTTQEYNGDFLNVPVRLNTTILSIIYVLCLIPYWIQWKIYKYFKNKKNTLKKVYVNTKLVEPFVILLLLAHIFIIIVFGVNRVGAPPYQAPAFIKLLIQILLRFDAILWGSFLILFLPQKKLKTTLLISFLLILIGILKGSLGIVNTIFLLFFIKYYKNIVCFIKKKISIVIIIAFLFPTLVEFAYTQRNLIRNVQYEEEKLEPGRLITGKLVGRLSSFSNAAFLVDDAPKYILMAQGFDDYFYQKGMLISIDAATYGKGDYSPEKYLKPNTQEGYSFMLGSTGILLFSLYKSFFVFIINFLSIIVISILIYWVLIRIKFYYNIELAYISLLYPTLSGVSSEYSFMLLITFIFFLTLLFLSTLNKLYTK